MSIFRERELLSEKKSGKTLIIVILVIVLIVLIIGIVLWFIFRNRSTTDDTVDVACISPADCSVGQLCVDNICRSLECVTPPAPTSISIVSPITGTIAISWNAVPTAQSYTVYLGTNPNFNKFNALDVLLSTDTTAEFINVVSGFNYFIFITSINECGEGVKSNTLSIFVTYIWPNKFVINGKFPNSVDYDLGLLGDESAFDKQLKLDNTCRHSNCACDFECNYVYDDSTSQIRRFGDATICLVDDGGEAKVDLCSSYTNNEKQWVYIENLDRICLLNNINDCLIMNLSSTIDVNNTSDSEFREKWRPILVA